MGTPRARHGSTTGKVTLRARPRRPSRDRRAVLIQLRIHAGPDVGRIFVIWAPGTYRIGRQEDCEFRIVNPAVSRKHLEIWIDDEWNITAREAGSTGGTELNGVPMDETETTIQSGDLLTLSATIRIGVSITPRIELPFLTETLQTKPGSEEFWLRHDDRIRERVTQELRSLTSLPGERQVAFIAVAGKFTTTRERPELQAVLRAVREGDIQDGSIPNAWFTLVADADITLANTLSERLRRCAQVLLETNAEFASACVHCAVVVLLVNHKSALAGAGAIITHLAESIDTAIEHAESVNAKLTVKVEPY